MRADYLARYGVDVGVLPGSGAAGGLAGGLAALGARLAPGFDAGATEVGLAEAVAAAKNVPARKSMERFSLIGVRGGGVGLSGALASCEAQASKSFLMMCSLCSSFNGGRF